MRYLRGGCAILEGVDQEAEAVVRVLMAEAEDLEHTLLCLGIVDTDGAAAHLGAVEHEVVGIGADALQILLAVAVEPVQMLGLGSGKRMVHGVEAGSLVVPLEQGEVHHPQGGEYLRVAQAETVAHLDTQGAEGSAHLVPGSGENQDQVALLSLNGCGHGGQVIGSEELVGRGLEGAVLIALDVDQALGAYLGTFYPLGQLVGLLAGVAGASGHRYTAHILSLHTSLNVDGALDICQVSMNTQQDTLFIIQDRELSPLLTMKLGETTEPNALTIGDGDYMHDPYILPDYAVVNINKTKMVQSRNTGSGVSISMEMDIQPSIILDRRTGEVSRRTVIDDILTMDETSPSFKCGYLAESYSPEHFIEISAKAMKEGNLSNAARKRISTILENLSDEDNNVIMLAPLKK